MIEVVYANDILLVGNLSGAKPNDSAKIDGGTTMVEGMRTSLPIRRGV